MVETRKKLTLLLAFHNHQPVGNFEHVFHETCDKCYLPFLRIALKYPSVKFALHYTGPLLEWFERNKPEILDMLKTLAERGQVEFLGGGFYEPMLAVIPERDAAGQIEMMRSFIRERFGAVTNGIWLAERVWDPDLPRVLAINGVKFTLLDDNAFFLAGVKENPVTGYYSTEKAGHRVAVFPIDKGLRYKIPFDTPENILKYLREILDRSEDSTCITYGDDGEKFGVWPGTYKLSYQDGWLERFFAALSGNTEWLEITTFSEYMRSRGSLGRIYLPSASYQEMMEWSAGIWQNFLSKYDECNLIHKKMIYVSKKVEEAAKIVNSPKVAEAKKALYRGQCNCAYWHGLFGGLYLNYLRHALFENLIKAEDLADSLLEEGTNVKCEILDFDSDFADEIILGNKKISALIKPSAGGNIIELDYRPLKFNLTNVLTRREEHYHKRLKETHKYNDSDTGGGVKTIHELHLSKEEGLERFLVYDRYPRNSFIVHLIHDATTLDSFESQNYQEFGNFASGSYFCRTASSGKDEEKCEIILSRAESLIYHGRANRVYVDKTIALSPGGQSLSLGVSVNIDGDSCPEMLLAVEFNFTLLAGNDPGRFFRIKGVELSPDERMMNSRGVLNRVNHVIFEDHWQLLRVTLGADEPLDFWRFPIETVSMSESGSERTYQGFCLTAIKRLSGEKCSHSMNLSITFENFGAEK